MEVLHALPEVHKCLLDVDVCDAHANNFLKSNII